MNMCSVQTMSVVCLGYIPGPCIRLGDVPNAGARRIDLHVPCLGTQSGLARRAEDPGCEVAPEDPGIKICPDKTLPDSDDGGDIAPPQREVSRACDRVGPRLNSIKWGVARGTARKIRRLCSRQAASPCW